MINFDEEIKKFQPSKESVKLEDAVRQSDITDMRDITIQMMGEILKEGQNKDMY